MRVPVTSGGRAVVSAFKLNFDGFLGWPVWLFIHVGSFTGYRNRVGAVLGWWFAFTRDLRRERTFTVDDMPAAAGPYSDQETLADSSPSRWWGHSPRHWPARSLTRLCTARARPRDSPFLLLWVVSPG